LQIKRCKKLRNKFSQVALLVVLLIISSLVVWVVWQSQYLRPAGDDYCYGAITAEHGILGGVVHWWNIWSGFIYAMFSGNLFVGFPLALLPLSLASAIPFVVTAVGMGITFIFLQKESSANIRFLVFLIPISMFCWWTFLWGSPFVNPRISSLVILASGLTFWQTINGQYVLVMNVLVIAFAILRFQFAYLQHRHFQTLFLVVLLGLISGSVGTALSLSILSVAICVLVWFIGMTLTKKTNDVAAEQSRRELQFWGILFLSTLMSMVICHIFSPGSHIRTQAISPNYSITFDRGLYIIASTFTGGVKIWLKSFFNYGALASLILMASIYFAGNKAKMINGSQKNLSKTAIFLLGFALLQCFINRLSEEFTYQGYWHFVSPLVCTFLSLLLFGASLGLYVARQSGFLLKSLVLILFVIALWVGVGANLLMVEAIHARYSMWIKGPAPGEGISDIANPNGWEMDCWNKLNNLRPSPTSRN